MKKKGYVTAAVAIGVAVGAFIVGRKMGAADEASAINALAADKLVQWKTQGAQPIAIALFSGQ